MDLGEKILLHIEKQAIVQCLLQQIALQFSSNENKPVITQDVSYFIMTPPMSPPTLVTSSNGRT